MVETELTQQLIDAGADLVLNLDKKGISPDAAYWLYSSELEGWRLYLAEAKVGRTGPKGVYRQIQRIIKNLPAESRVLELSDIGLVRSDSPFIRKLRTAIRTGHGISGIRFKNNVINGNVIEDAYIYRVA